MTFASGRRRAGRQTRSAARPAAELCLCERARPSWSGLHRRGRPPLGQEDAEDYTVFSKDAYMLAIRGK